MFLANLTPAYAETLPFISNSYSLRHVLCDILHKLAQVRNVRKAQPASGIARWLRIFQYLNGDCAPVVCVLRLLLQLFQWVCHDDERSYCEGIP